MSPLFHVSTIHSFLWSIIRPFQTDIATWVVARIDEKIGERQGRHAKHGTRAATKVRLEQEIADLEVEREAIGRVEKFTYETGSRYAEGILGHDDILRLTPACVAAHPLLRRVVARRFPYIFVDESQDTQPAVIEALRQIAGDWRERPRPPRSRPAHRTGRRTRPAAFTTRSRTARSGSGSRPGWRC